MNEKFRRDSVGLTHTVIHELGHVFRGGTFIEDDGPTFPVENQIRNNNEIWRKCFGVELR